MRKFVLKTAVSWNQEIKEDSGVWVFMWITRITRTTLRANRNAGSDVKSHV